MRIGIVTWYWGNYGSQLQAYALQEYLRLQGFDPVIIRHTLRDSTIQRAWRRFGIDGARKTCCSCKDMLIGRIVSKRYAENLALRLKALEQFAESYLPLTKRCYKTSDYQESLSEADAFICGSDQIWNPSITCYEPFYWLSYVPSAIKKIAYAPSIGFRKFSAGEQVLIRKNLDTFARLSVREQQSAVQLNELGLERNVETVVDPTLLLDAETWRRFVRRAACKSAQREPYLFAYLLRGSREQMAIAESESRRRGLRLVVYPYLERVPYDKKMDQWGDSRIFDDNTADFLSRIDNADFVITDSFHCTLFSILFHKDFFTLRKSSDRSSQGTRLDNLLQLSGQQGRLLDSLDNVPEEACDFTYSDERIDAEVQRSKDFLADALSVRVS